jgi:hypothetical protein
MKKIRVNPCSSVVNFSLCRRLSAVALAKADVFVAETQLVRHSLGEGGSIKND